MIISKKKLMKRDRKMTVRAEEQGLLFWNRDKAGTAYVSGSELAAVSQWASGDFRTEVGETGFLRRMMRLNLLSQESRSEILAAVQSAKEKKAPLRSFCAPESLHIELTSRCELCCPQCYKGKGGTQELPYELLTGLLAQAEDMQVFQIALGGGEPLLYPWLSDAVAEISRRNMSCSLTTSGWGLDRQRLNHLIHLGLNHIQVSLNGSSEEINSLSRDGYKTAVSALMLLHERSLSFGINWVARKDNLSDLPNMFELAVRLGAGNINILRYKPAVMEDYAAVCLNSSEQQKLAEMIRNRGAVSVKVDSAFSNLLCHLNGRSGLLSGCGAGRRFLAVDAAGNFRPCSHIALKERAKSLRDYWYDSPQLLQFREVEDKVKEPCADCSYLFGCRGCRAVVMGTGIEASFEQGDKECYFYKKSGIQ